MVLVEAYYPTKDGSKDKSRSDRKAERVVCTSGYGASTIWDTVTLNCAGATRWKDMDGEININIRTDG
jgi:hypothetical protein